MWFAIIRSLHGAGESTDVVREFDSSGLGNQVQIEKPRSPVKTTLGKGEQNAS